MSEQVIQLPTDFERTPEFQLLCATLTSLRPPGTPPTPAELPAELQKIEAIATRLWLRLWVVLAYEARTSNKPGWLGRSAGLLEQSVNALFGEDCTVVKLLADERVRLLELREPEPGVAPDYFCRQFAELNPHTAGSFVKKENRGQLRSAFQRQEKELRLLALQQGQLITPDKFRKANGDVMNDVEANRSKLVVVKIDRAIMRANRNPGDFTQGLLADACTAATTYGDEQIKEVCFWLLEARSRLDVPKTTEQILAQFENVAVMAGVKKANGQLL